jgi:hypothetical protein
MAPGAKRPAAGSVRSGGGSFRSNAEPRNGVRLRCGTLLARGARGGAALPSSAAASGALGAHKTATRPARAPLASPVR